MHKKEFITAGAKLEEASKVLILVHGRGGSAADILSLADYFDVDGLSLLAPQATNNSWYPYSFLVPTKQNEPWLSAAIALLKEITADMVSKGIKQENIFFLGFSQGACLVLEFVTRNAIRYGGVAAFTGGLIGEEINTENYSGDFSGTPFFIGTSDPDPHVPVARVMASATLLENMGAVLSTRIYKGMGHIISQDEIANANRILFNRSV
jgi:phospholipase/carboxylesterase